MTHYTRWQKHGDPLTLLKRKQGAALRYLRETVIPYDGDDCLVWPFNRNWGGYGYVAIGRDKRMVPRLVCEAINGPAPSPSHEVAHSCGNGHKGCVTPSHLRWASHKENESDKIKHGTINRGRRNGGNTLDESDVLAIYSLRNSMPQRAIAERYGVTQTTVSKIHRGDKWGWLTGASKT